MDIEKELKRVADLYTGQGYQVKIRPRPEDLPSFAKDFKVEIVGKRGDEGILVAVKKNRAEMKADADMARYAEVTGAQPGWRFDFVILEGESSMGRQGGAQEPSDEHLNHLLRGVHDLVGKAYVNPAMISAWAALEAAMRRRLRAEGENAGWGTQPRQMMNELYSTGIFSAEEFARLEQASRLRNEIVHGFVPTAVDPTLVQFLIETAVRLLEESQAVKQPA
jgi:hypothetical protein